MCILLLKLGVGQFLLKQLPSHIVLFGLVVEYAHVTHELVVVLVLHFIYLSLYPV